MPDLKEVIERLERDAAKLRVDARGPLLGGVVAFARVQGTVEGLEHALSALKPLLEKNDG